MNSTLAVKCRDGYELKGSACIEKPDESKAKLNIIMGAGMGIVLAGCAGLMLYLIITHPQRSKKIFLSFVRMRHVDCTHPSTHDRT